MTTRGRYRIVRRIGRGGMADVFEAIAVGHRGVERRVAVKQLLTSSSQRDESTLKMFFDEARIASRLHHGNVVALLDYGTTEGQPFQVLEFVDGLDARSMCRRGDQIGAPIPVEIALHVATEVAHALHYSHSLTDEHGHALGIIHRDVKPANVMVSWQGDVKLGDFGIAFAFDREERTRAGGVKGTPSYMAPEQLTGGDIDGRVDVFSLGCTLHAMLTGMSPASTDANRKRLFAGETLQLADGLPGDVEKIIGRAVAPRRENRYASAAELARDLGAALAVRLERDAKSVCMEWLERIRAAPDGGRGRLDELLQVELVLTGVESGRRNFETFPGPTGAWAPTLVTLPGNGVGRRLRVLGAGRSRGRLQRRWALPVVAVTIGMAGVTLAVVLGAPVQSSNHAKPSAAPAASASARPAPPHEPSVAIDAWDNRASGAAAPAAPAAPAASRHTSSTHTPARPVVRAVQRAASTRSSAGAPPATVAVTTGTLAVGGAGAVGATILVDGIPMGLAPKYIQLPIGAHNVTVIGHDDQKRSFHVMIDATNTRRAPSRISVR